MLHFKIQQQFIMLQQKQKKNYGLIR